MRKIRWTLMRNFWKRVSPFFTLLMHPKYASIKWLSDDSINKSAKSFTFPKIMY